MSASQSVLRASLRLKRALAFLLAVWSFSCANSLTFTLTGPAISIDVSAASEPDTASNTGNGLIAFALNTEVPKAPVPQTIAAGQTAPVSPVIGHASDGSAFTYVSSTNLLPLTGTAEPNCTINIFDGTTLLGTTTTNPSGSWSYTTAPLTKGIHSFSETATDTASNTSQASPVLNVAVQSDVTLTSDMATYSNNTWTYFAATNPWNKANLVNGKDYWMKVSLNPVTFPNGVNASWSFPMTPWYLRTFSSSWNVRAFPEIKFMPHDSLGNQIFTQVGNFVDLTSSYDVNISGDTGNFNIAYDIFLYSKPNGIILDELMVWVHQPTARLPINQSITVTVPGLGNASFEVVPAKDAAGWRLIGLGSPTDALSSTISISDIFKTLIWNGLLTGHEYVGDIMFGAEVTAGLGRFQLNRFSNNWTANATQIGASGGNDTFTIGTIGGNNVFGRGGNNTVIYSGLFSTFQIRRSGIKILVMRTGDISSLDVLEDIQHIQFSDGTYNVSNENFTTTVAQ